MEEFSRQGTVARIKRLTWVIGGLGTVAVLIARGPREAALFMAGALLSAVNLRSWARLADAAAGENSPRVRAGAVFFALRYILIGAALYAIVKVLGISPVAMIVGLLVSFAAVLAGLTYEFVISK